MYMVQITTKYKWFQKNSTTLPYLVGLRHFFRCLLWLPNGTKFTPKHIRVQAFQHKRVHTKKFSNVSMDLESKWIEDYVHIKFRNLSSYILFED